MRRAAVPWVAVAVGAFALQVLLAPRELTRIHGYSYEGGLADTSLVQWWFAFFVHAVRHAQNPFLTDLLHPPGGVNAVQNVSMLLPSALLSPVTAIWGSSTSFNLLVFLAAPLTAIASYAWLRRHAGPLGAAAGAFPIAFNASEVSPSAPTPSSRCCRWCRWCSSCSSGCCSAREDAGGTPCGSGCS